MENPSLSFAVFFGGLGGGRLGVGAGIVCWKINLYDTTYCAFYIEIILLLKAGMKSPPAS